MRRICIITLREALYFVIVVSSFSTFRFWPTLPSLSGLDANRVRRVYAEMVSICLFVSELYCY